MVYKANKMKRAAKCKIVDCHCGKKRILDIIHKSFANSKFEVGYRSDMDYFRKSWKKRFLLAA